MSQRLIMRCDGCGRVTETAADDFNVPDGWWLLQLSVRTSKDTSMRVVEHDGAWTHHACSNACFGRVLATLAAVSDRKTQPQPR